MHIKGYGGNIRFGMEFPVTFDLECQPGYVSASTFELSKGHPLESVILLVRDKKDNLITLYVFQYFDEIDGVVPIDDDIEVEILYDNRKDK